MRWGAECGCWAQLFNYFSLSHSLVDALLPRLSFLCLIIRVQPQTTSRDLLFNRKIEYVKLWGETGALYRVLGAENR